MDDQRSGGVEAVDYAPPHLARRRPAPGDDLVVGAFRWLWAAIVILPFLVGILVVGAMLAFGPGTVRAGELPFWPLVMASVAVDGAVGLAVLLFNAIRLQHRPRITVSVPRLVLAALVTMAVFAPKVGLMFALGVNAFGVMSLIYWDFVALVPLVGLALLAAHRLTHHRPRVVRLTPAARRLVLLPLFIPPVAAYAAFVEPYRLRLEEARVPVPAERAGTDELRIGILADIQTGRITDHERSAVDRVMTRKPSVILMPGDLFQGSGHELERELAGFKTLLSRISAPGGVFFVMGDCERPDRLERLLADSGVRLLLNEIAQSRVDDRLVTIAGVELDHTSAAARATIRRLADLPGDDDIRILLAHRPDVVRELPANSRVDLVVAGHTHGGQIVIPLFGPPITFSDVPRRIAAGGLHDYLGNAIYVSRGIGLERGQAPRLRLFCPPEVTLLTVGDE